MIENFIENILSYFELRHAAELDVVSVGVVQHGGVGHGHPRGVRVLVRHPHLLGERLHGGHRPSVQK